jgi:hypothetical protein
MLPPMMRCVFVEDQLGEALLAAIGQRASRRRPGEDALAVGDAFGPALLFGLAGPGDFRVGVGDRRDLQGVEAALAAVRGFGGDVRFVHPLCASIGWPTMSPMAKMCGTLVRNCVSTGMKPRSLTATPAFSAASLLAVRRAADGDQHEVEAFFFSSLL